MSYNTMNATGAVTAFLEDHAPAKPKAIVAATGKTPNQVYAALYQLKKAGKVKRLGAEGWTVVHRAPKAKAKPKQNTVRQYDISDLEEAQVTILNLLAARRDRQKEYDELKAVAKYLEKRNGQLLARIWEIENDVAYQEE
jgi:predicted Zn-ribbon and HTH transcriptional regulator